MKLIRVGLVPVLLGISAMAIADNPESGEEDLQTKGSDPSEIISRLEIRNE